MEFRTFACLLVLVTSVLVARPLSGQVVEGGELVVQDVDGKTVGQVLGFDGPGYTSTALFIDGEPVFLKLVIESQNETEGLLDADDGVGLHFEQANCVGPGYMFNAYVRDNERPIQAVNSNEFSLWMGTSTLLISGLEFRSTLGLEGACLNHEPLGRDVITAKRLATGLRPPFRLGMASNSAEVLSVPALSPLSLTILISALGLLGILVLRGTHRL